MEQSKKDAELGRFLSLVLRHNPQAAYVQIDAHGLVEVDALLKGCCRAGKSLDRETLERIVQENNKQRYSFNEDHRKIRANQGHSLPVDVELRSAKPPAILYHGTAARFLDSILSQGITRQSRQFVHLSSDSETARQVGSRHGNPVVLHIDAAAMEHNGIPFYLSQNGVWLCKQISTAYIINL